MKNIVLPLVAGLLVVVFEREYDNFLLWLYDNDGMVTFLVRYFAVVWLVERAHALYARNKAQTATGDNAA